MKKTIAPCWVMFFFSLVFAACLHSLSICSVMDRKECIGRIPKVNLHKPFAPHCLMLLIMHRKYEYKSFLSFAFFYSHDRRKKHTKKLEDKRARHLKNLPHSCKFYLEAKVKKNKHLHVSDINPWVHTKLCVHMPVLLHTHTQSEPSWTDSIIHE